MKTLAIAAVAAALLAASNGAAAAPREAVGIRLDTASVDFADSASVAKFRRSVQEQVNAVCNPGNRLNADVTPDFQCRKEMLASLEPRIQALVAKAGGNRFASVN